MGSWDIDAFGNDTAADWGWTLDGIDDLSVVEETLDRILSTGNDYLDASIAEEGVAAVEALARAQGKGGASTAFTESVDSWVTRLKALPSSSLSTKAVTVVDRIITAPSELLGLLS